MSANDAEPDIDGMLAAKQKELFDVQQLKIRALERRLTEKDERIAGEQAKYEELVQSFNYNLSIIEQLKGENA